MARFLIFGRSKVPSGGMLPLEDHKREFVRIQNQGINSSYFAIALLIHSNPRVDY
mgnify:CR=1 FL=1